MKTATPLGMTPQRSRAAPTTPTAPTDQESEQHFATARQMAADGSAAARKRAFVWLLKLGYSRARIGLAFGVSRQRIHAVTAEAVGSGFYQVVEQEREQRAKAAAPLFASGLSRGAVAQRLAIGEHELHGMLASAHRRVEAGNAPKWARMIVQAIEQGKKRVKVVREAYRTALVEQVGRAINDSGKSLQDIAATTGLSRSSLYELAHNSQKVPWSPSPDFLARLATAVPAVRSIKIGVPGGRRRHRTPAN